MEKDFCARAVGRWIGVLCQVKIHGLLTARFFWLKRGDWSVFFDD